MFGKQFDKTYWEDPETGKTHFFAPQVQRGPFRSYSPVGVVTRRSEPLRNTSYQGMLFHPDVGTGRRTDEDQEARDSAAREALGFREVVSRGETLSAADAYTKRVRSAASNHDDPLMRSSAQEHMDQLTAALTASDMPTETIKRLSSSTIIIPNEGRSVAFTDGRIHIRRSGGKPDTDALIHELGHSTESFDKYTNLEDTVVPDKKKPFHVKLVTGRPDPRSEGIADGFDDRFRRLESAKDNPALHTDTGYTTGFSGFKDKTMKAAYVAARAHSASSDDAAFDIPTREYLMGKAKGIDIPSVTPSGLIMITTRSGKSVSIRRHHLDEKDAEIADARISGIPDQLLVGHLAHEHPHVRQALEAQGLGKAAEKALTVYRDAFPPVPHAVEISTGAAGKISKDQFRMRRYVESLNRKDEGHREVPGQLAFDF